MIDFHLHLTEENSEVATGKRGEIQKKPFLVYETTSSLATRL
jgi:hypothetical protein